MRYLERKLCFKLFYHQLLALLSICLFSQMIACKKLELEKQYKESATYGWTIQLNPDGTLTNSFAGEGCGIFTGTFVKTSNGFNYSGTADEGICGNIKSGNGECTLKELAEDLFFLQELNCTGPFSIANYKGKSITTELPRTFDNIQVITFHKSGTVTKNAYIRERPNQSANEAHCEQMGENGITNQSSILPASKSVQIVARTPNKEKVDSWENYWYMVDAGDWYFHCQGWVFGEFVAIQ